MEPSSATGSEIKANISVSSDDHHSIYSSDKITSVFVSCELMNLNSIKISLQTVRSDLVD